MIFIKPKTDTKTVFLPLFQSLVQAGFPSPAEDYGDTKLDLNEFLISHPSSTFFVKVIGDSMIEAGISENDIIIVDKSLTPSNGQIILAVVEGDFTIKRFIHQRIKIGGKLVDKMSLHPANINYQPIEITEESNFQVWGVVTYTIKKNS